MPRAESPSAAAAEDIYKQLLRQERTAWDALFARPICAQTLRQLRRATAEANAARVTFLNTSSSDFENAGHPKAPVPADRTPSATQPLREAIQRQKKAWATLQPNMESDVGQDRQLYAEWLNAVRAVRAARKRVDQQSGNNTNVGADVFANLMQPQTSRPALPTGAAHHD